MINNEFRGAICAIFSGFLYGFIAYFGLNALSSHFNEGAMLFWRFSLSCIFILIFFFPWLRQKRESPKELWRLLIAGIFCYGTSSLLYFLACRYISSGIAMVSFFTYPLFIMLYNILFKRQAVVPLYFGAMLVMMLGMCCFIDLRTAQANVVGIFLAMASAICYAAYILTSKRSTVSPHMSTLMVCAGCTIPALVHCLVDNSLAWPASSIAWFYLFGIAIISTVLPILFLLYSLQLISAEKASLLSVLEPVFVVILGMVLLHEKLSLKSLAGIILVLAGALITLLESNPQSGQTVYKEKLDMSQQY
ncbi:MAG: EamA family transporter [Legionella sp.]|nr:EamA family transporter [Legionella sp.]